MPSICIGPTGRSCAWNTGSAACGCRKCWPCAVSAVKSLRQAKVRLMAQRTKDEWQLADDSMPDMVNQGGRTPNAAPLVFCWQQWPAQRSAVPRTGTALAAAIQQKYGQSAAQQRRVRVEPGEATPVSEGAHVRAGFGAEPLPPQWPLALQTTQPPANHLSPPRPDTSRPTSHLVAAAQQTPTFPGGPTQPVTPPPAGPACAACATICATICAARRVHQT